MASVANINDVLDGHVGLEIECVDRLYLNAYVAKLQVPGQVARFLHDHLGLLLPSPAAATFPLPTRGNSTKSSPRSNRLRPRRPETGALR